MYEVQVSRWFVLAVFLELAIIAGTYLLSWGLEGLGHPIAAGAIRILGSAALVLFFLSVAIGELS